MTYRQLKIFYFRELIGPTFYFENYQKHASMMLGFIWILALVLLTKIVWRHALKNFESAWG